MNDKNEIKKRIYRNKPIASFVSIRMGVAYYIVNFGEVKVYFEIPVSDMGTANFLPKMEAKHLLRWIV